MRSNDEGENSVLDETADHPSANPTENSPTKMLRVENE
jgi:hypothetical protein